MSREVLLKIVTPERVVYEDNVEMAIAKGMEGEIGILYDHSPLVTPMPSGILKIRKNKKFYPVAISGGGFLEIKPDQVSVLADAAELPEEIDLDRAGNAKRRAEERLERGKDEGIDVKRARAALQRAITRISAAGQRER